MQAYELFVRVFRITPIYPSSLNLAVLSSYGSLVTSKQPLRFHSKLLMISTGCSYYIPVTFCDLIGAAIYLQWGQVKLLGSLEEGPGTGPIRPAVMPVSSTHLTNELS